MNILLQILLHFTTAISLMYTANEVLKQIQQWKRTKNIEQRRIQVGLTVLQVVILTMWLALEIKYIFRGGSDINMSLVPITYNYTQIEEPRSTSFFSKVKNYITGGGSRREYRVEDRIRSAKSRIQQSADEVKAKVKEQGREMKHHAHTAGEYMYETGQEIRRQSSNRIWLRCFFIGVSLLRLLVTVVEF